MAKNTLPDDLPVMARTLDFYQVEASVVGEEARKLLHEYSKIPEDQIDSHVESIRKTAFEIFPYPCIGMFRFLDLSLKSTDVYSEVLSRLKAGETFLDLGCCFGQELRQLVYDGVPSENLYGSDLRPEFIQLGYQLFGDKDTIKATFIPSDIFDNSSELQKQLASKIDIIYTGSFFHLFDLEEQYRVARQVIKLIRAKPGGIIIGRQVGNIEPGTYNSPGYSGERTRFRHNEESWKEFWEKIGKETGTKWEVKAVLDNLWMKKGPEGMLSENRGESGARRLRFIVKRL